MSDIPMLTTKDNPFDPRVQWDDWYRWDEDMGYATCGLLARFAYTSPELTDSENKEAIEAAIDEIIKNDPTGLYMKLEATDEFKQPIKTESVEKN